MCCSNGSTRRLTGPRNGRLHSLSCEPVVLHHEMDLPILVADGEQIVLAVVEKLVTRPIQGRRRSGRAAGCIHPGEHERFFPSASYPVRSRSLISGTPAAAKMVGTTSSNEKIPLSTCPAGISPVQRITRGARNPPSHPRPFSPRKGDVPPSGPAEFLRTVIRREDDDRVVCNPQGIELREQFADDPVQFLHTICIETELRLAAPALGQARPHMHARGIVPQQEGLAGRMSPGR